MAVERTKGSRFRAGDHLEEHAHERSGAETRHIRFFDPTTGQYLLNYQEAERARQEAEERAVQEVRARELAEARVAELEARLRSLQS